MAFEIKENSGSLFKNDRKTEESHPQAKGSAKINGIEYWVSAWTKTTKEGVKWQSLSFTVKDAKPQQPNSFDDITDNIPWDV